MVLTLPHGGPGDVEDHPIMPATAQATVPLGRRDLPRERIRIAQQIQRERNGAALKYQEWATLLPGISRRALERAMLAGTLEWTEKGYGRDHGARMVTPAAMLTYLQGQVSTENEGAAEDGRER